MFGEQWGERKERAWEHLNQDFLPPLYLVLKVLSLILWMGALTLSFWDVRALIWTLDLIFPSRSTLVFAQSERPVYAGWLLSWTECAYRGRCWSKLFVSGILLWGQCFQVKNCWLLWLKKAVVSASNYMSLSPWEREGGRERGHNFTLWNWRCRLESLRELNVMVTASTPSNPDSLHLNDSPGDSHRWQSLRTTASTSGHQPRLLSPYSGAWGPFP